MERAVFFTTYFGLRSLVKIAAFYYTVRLEAAVLVDVGEGSVVWSILRAGCAACLPNVVEAGTLSRSNIYGLCSSHGE